MLLIVSGKLLANSFPEKINSLLLGAQIGIDSKISTSIKQSFIFNTDFKPSNFMCILSPDRGYAISLDRNSYKYIVSIFYQPSRDRYPYGCIAQTTSSGGTFFSIYYDCSSDVSVSFQDTSIGLTSSISRFYGALLCSLLLLCILGLNNVVITGIY